MHFLSLWCICFVGYTVASSVHKSKQNINYKDKVWIYLAFSTFMEYSKAILLNAKDYYDHFTVPLPLQSTDEYCYDITIFVTINLIVDPLHKIYIFCNIKQYRFHFESLMTSLSQHISPFRCIIVMSTSNIQLPGQFPQSRFEIGWHQKPRSSPKNKVV